MTNTYKGKRCFLFLLEFPGIMQLNCHYLICLFLSNDKETIYFIFKKKGEKKREKLPIAQI